MALKFLRIVFLYVVLFFVAVIVGISFVDQIGDGLFALYIFVAPGLLVWWYEKRRSRRVALQKSAPAQSEAPSRSSPPLVDPKTTGSDAIAWDRRAPTSPGVLGKAAATPSHAQKKPMRQQKGWVPKGEVVSIHTRDIPGLVYFGTAPSINTHGYGEKCRAYIDPSLPVARAGHDKEGKGMPYWPGYSSIPPECRATYLDWLAAGAKDGSYSPGYMFLYFYGIERRFFVDEPGVDERRDLIEEVRRLSDLFAENRSAQRYLSDFIEFAVVSITEVGSIQPVFDHSGWEVPFSVKLAIGAHLENGDNLDAGWLLSWFLCHPEKNLRTSAKRCRDEFISLFRVRFNARFPQGLKVSKPRKMLQGTYQAASREFNRTVNPTINGKPVPDISGLRKPIEIAQEIADEVMDELEKFSRYIGRNPDGRGSVEAHALLPTELRQMFPSEDLDRIKRWATEAVEQGGLVPVGDVIQRLEGARPAKLGKRQLTGAADALARLGYGLAPDPRFALRSPQIDEPVVIFDLGGEVEQLEQVSTKYKAALMELALASFVAHADGVITELERKNLDNQARTVEGLTDHEKRRLRANLEWFLAVPPDMSLLRRKLKDTEADQQSAIRAALVAAAHADGVVRPEEVAEIEKVYRALGLDPNLIYSDLHAGGVPDAPLRVREARPGMPGEAIPVEPQPQGTKLDADRIASIRQDTDRVSAVLADIFSVDVDDEDGTEEAPMSVLAGLDQKHSALVREIISRQHWSEQEFSELATRHGLLAAGALETVNEWAFGAYDEALLEEYEGYDVSPEIADALADEFEKEI